MLKTVKRHGDMACSTTNCAITTSEFRLLVLYTPDLFTDRCEEILAPDNALSFNLALVACWTASHLNMFKCPTNIQIYSNHHIFEVQKHRPCSLKLKKSHILQISQISSEVKKTLLCYFCRPRCGSQWPHCRGRAGAHGPEHPPFSEKQQQVLWLLITWKNAMKNKM